MKFRQLNIIGTVYHIPDNCDVAFTDNSIALLLYLSKHINKTTKSFITSYLNINIIVYSSKTRYFLNTLRSVDLYHLNEKPTLEHACIDNVLSMNGRCDEGISLIETLMSDHDGLMLSDVGVNRLTNF